METAAKSRSRRPRSGTLAMPPGARLGFNGYLEIHRDPLSFLSRLARQHGDLCHFQRGRQRFVLLNHPDLIKELMVTQNHNFRKGGVLSLAQETLGSGLLTSNGGERHLAHRRALQPALRSQRIGAFASLITEYASEATVHWKEGRTLDIYAEMLELTLMIFIKVLLNLRGQAALEMRDAFYQIFEAFEFMTKPFARRRMQLPTRRMKRFHAARSLVEARVYSMLSERHDAGDRGDILSVMMGHHAAAGDRGDVRFTAEQIRDEVFTFIIAGNYTTAALLTWTWFMLAQHPMVEERLHAELDDVLGESAPTLASMGQLPYTRMVLSETLRMYPPVWLSSRKALTDCEIGGYQIPAGTLVLPSQYVIHRDPRFYPDPEQFNPDRWTPQAQAQRPRHAFFPFALGTRTCLGESFAWMEGTLILATLAQQWRLRVSPGFRVKVYPGVILRPKQGLLMTIHGRERNPRGTGKPPDRSDTSMPGR